MSISTEPIRASASQYKVLDDVESKIVDPSDRLSKQEPLVSALLVGGECPEKQIENLVRLESASQGVDLPREDRPRYSYVRFLKPMLDRSTATVLLLILMPLFLPIAAAVKLTSRGSVFFIQERTGYLGRRFKLFKFRTMVQNAEELKKDLMAENIFGKDSPDFKLKKDPRITRVGAFLRKTSLDELPNLINVIRGDMSLIGPRPTSFKATTYRKNHLPRLATTPGLTGLWQVSGRADINFDDRSQLDVEYIKSISLLNDISICYKTLEVVVSRRGAY